MRRDSCGGQPPPDRPQQFLNFFPLPQAFFGFDLQGFVPGAGAMPMAAAVGAEV